MAAIVAIAMLGCLVAYAVLGFTISKNAGVGNAGPSQFPVFAMAIVFTVIFTAVLLTMIRRQKRLLIDGEMCMAGVVDRIMARNGPNIRYDFTTPLGEHLSGGAVDGTRNLSIEMAVPVFYDPQNPKRQLALCASFFEIILPGNE